MSLPSAGQSQTKASTDQALHVIVVTLVIPIMLLFSNIASVQSHGDFCFCISLVIVKHELALCHSNRYEMKDRQGFEKYKKTNRLS